MNMKIRKYESVSHHVDSSKQGHEFTQQSSTQAGNMDERALSGETVRTELAVTTLRS